MNEYDDIARETYETRGRNLAASMNFLRESMEAFADGFAQGSPRKGEEGRLPLSVAWECAHVERPWREERRRRTDGTASREEADVRLVPRGGRRNEWNVHSHDGVPALGVVVRDHARYHAYVGVHHERGHLLGVYADRLAAARAIVNVAGYPNETGGGR